MAQSTNKENASSNSSPIWSTFRQRIFSLVRSKTLNLDFMSGAVGGVKSPTGSKFFNGSPSKRSPVKAATPHQSSNLHRPFPISAPTSRCPSCSTPPQVSPPLRRHSFAKNRRNSSCSIGEGEIFPHYLHKGLSKSSPRQPSKLAIKKENSSSFDSSCGTTAATSPVTPTSATKTRQKLKNVPTKGQSIDLQKMEDDLRFAERNLQPRKWSYHGTASPSTVISAPKRHSFSTSSDHKAGIVVSNNDLASLLCQNSLLPPGTELLPMQFPFQQLSSTSNPKSRGRSQSIAACAQTSKILAGKFAASEPVAPITIKTIDCDHFSAKNPLYETVEPNTSDTTEQTRPDKLLWDSSGSTFNVNLLGSAIEKYLKSPTGNEKESESVVEKSSAQAVDKAGSSQPTKDDPLPNVTPPMNRLQVK